MTTGWPAALEGTEQASRRWDDEQRETVLRAIQAVALDQREFTADDVWRKLDGAVPVTKGLTGSLVKAKGLGYCEQTDRVTIARRGGQHDHAQRLVVWRSLIYWGF